MGGGGFLEQNKYRKDLRLELVLVYYLDEARKQKKKLDRVSG